jgi:hypothetical protein
MELYSVVNQYSPLLPRARCELVLINDESAANEVNSARIA